MKKYLIIGLVGLIVLSGIFAVYKIMSNNDNYACPCYTRNQVCECGHENAMCHYCENKTER